MTATVDTPTARYDQLATRRKLPRALLGGTTAMQQAGQEFLRQHPAESDDSYNVRLLGTTLYNGFEQAVTAQTGKVFSEPVAVGEDVPPLVEELLGDIDGQGRQLTPFALDLFYDAMVDGISFILVDFPVMKKDGSIVTLADQQLAKARPYWVPLTADQVIGIRSTTINGTRELTEVRIRETTEVADGEWGQKEVKRIRVLRPGSYEIHEYIDDGANRGQYVLVDEGVTTWPNITLVPVYTNRVGFFEGEPPLRPLAELNLEHWQSSSEQRKALTFCRFAMLALIGVDAKSEVSIGPDKTLKLPAGADAKYVEPSGEAIAAGRKDLEAIEQRMQSAGMTLRVEQAGTVTATVAALDSQDSNAGLRAVADSLGDSLELALLYTARMLGLDSGGSIAVNTDFAQPVATGTVAELTSAVSVGTLSLETYLTELKRRGVLDDALDVQDEIERISNTTILGDTHGTSTEPAADAGAGVDDGAGGAAT